MQDRLPNTDWDLFMEYQRGEHDKFRLAKDMANEINGASLDPKEPHPIDKELLAMRTVEQYTGLQKTIGHEKASQEMSHALSEFVLNAELNQFEADMIATLAILGNVATFALNEVERLDGRQS